MENHQRNDVREKTLREIFFFSRGKTFFNWYRSFFSIEEIEFSRVLQWFFGAMLFAFFLTFSSWASGNETAISSFLNNTHVCWPYFKNCGQFLFLEKLPYGYSQTFFYMGLFAIMLAIPYAIHKKDWVLAHMGLLALFLWKFLVIFLLSYDAGRNYDFYHIILTGILLFFPFKEFFLQFFFVFFYFLCSTIKIHEGWILGSYFTTLQTGLPIFGNILAPIAGGIVIVMQMFGSWFLMSGRKLYQRLALTYFVLFHMYSGILVEYNYPATVLPALLILFGPWYRKLEIPLNKKAIPGWLLAVVLMGLQLFPVVAIQGDQKMTLEGNRYAFYMFEANHQCRSELVTYKKDGTVEKSTKKNAIARVRCDPYKVWFTANQSCQRDPSIERIAWTFDHSIDGGPFYRIIDEKNVCGLTYSATSHNPWIKLPEDNPVIVGYPVKNVYF